jgi:CRP-like cAMP-binding protein/Fe-S-cluster-containing hydrogenase component 2/thioredoxin reductase
MALPDMLPLRENHVPFTPGCREEVLQQWKDYVGKLHLHIQPWTEVTGIVKQGDVFNVRTKQDIYRAMNVVLAVGAGNLRELDVPGAKLAHVKYTVDNPDAYDDQNVLVVGGGVNAVEVALTLSKKNRVTIAHRSLGFRELNPGLKHELDAKISHQEITVYYNANVAQIEPGVTVLEVGGEHQPQLDLFPRKERVPVQADWVFVQIGAVPPEKFLESCGVICRKVGGAIVPTLKQSDSPLEQFQSEQMDGLFLVGAVIGKNLIKSALNQGYEVIDHLLHILPSSPGEDVLMQKLEDIEGASVEAKLKSIAACVPLLQEVPLPQLREMALLSTVHKVGEAQEIGVEGKYATALYAIINGCVKLTSHDASNNPIMLHQGEFFGEELLSDRPLATSATAVHASVLLAIPRKKILEVAQHVPSLQHHLEGVQTLRTLQRSLCPDLPLEEVRPLAAKAQIRSLQKDEVIFKKGEPADALYVVLSGSVKMSNTDKEGRECLMTYLEGGEYFGEAGLLHATTDVREVTATVATPCQIIRIPKDDLLTFVRAHARLEKQMKRKSSQRMQQHAALATTPQPPADLVGQLDLVSSRDVLLINESKCIRCNNCVPACAATHHGQARLNRASGPSFAHVHVPVSCRHCEGAPCLQDCPPGDAIVRDANGVVQIFADKCIGCGNCARFCPYKAISMVESPQLQTSWVSFTHLIDLLRPKKAHAYAQEHRSIASKCDLCFDVDGGPACVRHCPTGQPSGSNTETCYTRRCMPEPCGYIQEACLATVAGTSRSWGHHGVIASLCTIWL